MKRILAIILAAAAAAALAACTPSSEADNPANTAQSELETERTVKGYDPANDIDLAAILKPAGVELPDFTVEGTEDLAFPKIDIMREYFFLRELGIIRKEVEYIKVNMYAAPHRDLKPTDVFANTLLPDIPVQCTISLDGVSVEDLADENIKAFQVRVDFREKADRDDLYMVMTALNDNEDVQSVDVTTFIFLADFMRVDGVERPAPKIGLTKQFAYYKERGFKSDIFESIAVVFYTAPHRDMTAVNAELLQEIPGLQSVTLPKDVTLESALKEDTFTVVARFLGCDADSFLEILKKLDAREDVAYIYSENYK